MSADRREPRRRTRIVSTGVVFVVVVLVVGLAAGGRPNNLLVWVFSAMLASLLVSGIVSGFMLLGLRATRVVPRRGRVGEPLLVRYELVNRARFLPAYDIRVEEKPAVPPRAPSRGASPVEPPRLAPAGNAWVLHIGPRDTVHAEAVFRPLRRGPVRLSAFEVSSTFPFGFLRKVLRFEAEGETLIHPEILPVRAEVLSRVTAGGFGGHRMSGAPGGGDDFFGVREYRPGDSVRQIAWKRLAGTGRLASIERSRAVPPRVRILLDLRTPTDRIRLAEGEDARTLEERAIVLAASLLALADRLGYEYALAVAGLDIPPNALRRGHFHREKLMSLLAALDLDAPRSAGNGLASSDERATVVAVHPDRADTAIAPATGWHFTARRIDAILEPREATTTVFTATARAPAAGGAP